MWINARASRVVVGGLDMLPALGILMWGTMSVPVVMAAIAGLFGWNDLAAFGAAIVGHAAVAAGCRYRLVVDGRGSVLSRTWLGIPWSRRPYGRRPSVTVVAGWDWEELVIVPERPHDPEDHFIAMETGLTGSTEADFEASANVADREIARVTTPPAPVCTTPYRSPPLAGVETPPDGG